MHTGSSSWSLNLALDCQFGFRYGQLQPSAVKVQQTGELTDIEYFEHKGLRILPMTSLSHNQIFLFEAGLMTCLMPFLQE